MGQLPGDLHTLGVVPHRQHHQTQDKPCKPTGQREKQRPEWDQIFDLS